mmetsp:Transcript_19895/g.40767  ORF Transcript_19895/g.40767 Transcript_19895/m.40767 type:complete len:207 (-) Transcript_19895:19-639(-)
MPPCHPRWIRRGLGCWSFRKSASFPEPPPAAAVAASWLAVVVAAAVAAGFAAAACRSCLGGRRRCLPVNSAGVGAAAAAAGGDRPVAIVAAGGRCFLRRCFPWCCSSLDSGPVDFVGGVAVAAAAVVVAAAFPLSGFRPRIGSTAAGAAVLRLVGVPRSLWKDDSVFVCRFVSVFACVEGNEFQFDKDRFDIQFNSIRFDSIANSI